MRPPGDFGVRLTPGKVVAIVWLTITEGTAMRYMVSYHHVGGKCGNYSGSWEAVQQYINTHKADWRSYSIFKYDSTPNLTGVYDLISVD